MKRIKIGILSLSALVGMGALALPGTSAQALSLVNVTQAQDQNSQVQTVQERRRIIRRWNRDRHGPRYRERRRGYRHYHDGYYYRTPWWLAPAVIGGAIIGGAIDNDGYRGGNRHVRWCLDRYRSYDPRTNTWVSYSGNVNQCDSPYN